ncbi:hypothetical protein MFLO_05934 [Listeria floridensis FSL S10-1187]|uniref:Uncharacterized protein n=1 Tax=Listeria floridensis FSL S10-1187 TaxID=1265817 RepID=A0ABP3B1B0_9LIST|nr:hypothetical protein MFLO_05934 [Listeria floridensis FSL S10-1187]
MTEELRCIGCGAIIQSEDKTNQAMHRNHRL